MGFEPHRLRYEGFTSALAECRANNLQPKRKGLSILFATVDGIKQGVCRAEQAQARADDYATAAEGREENGQSRTPVPTFFVLRLKSNRFYGIIDISR